MSAQSLFLRLRSAYCKARTQNRYYAYETHFFTQVAKIANDKGVTDVAVDESPLVFTPWCITVALNGEPKISLRR